MLLFLPDEVAPAAAAVGSATAPALLLLFDDEADGLLVRRDERRRDPVSFDDFLLVGLVSILLACDAACDEPAAPDSSELVGPSLFFLLPDLPIDDTRLYLVGSCSRLAALACWSSLRLWSSLLPVAFRPLDALAMLLKSPALLFALLEDDDG